METQHDRLEQLNRQIIWLKAALKVKMAEYNEVDLGNTSEDASAPPGCIVKGSPKGMTKELFSLILMIVVVPVVVLAWGIIRVSEWILDIGKYRGKK